jgi:uncharacterized protein (UPF0218 family)
MFRLPVEHRHRFRKPFGTLYSHFSDVVPLLSGKTVYTVGDVVTRNCLMSGLSPKVAIIDGHTMRIPCRNTPLLFAPRKDVKNPAGTITRELIDIIRDAVAHPPALIFVDGEEDLGVIPLVMLAPAGVFVLYGQPGEGVVVRLVDAEAKKAAKRLFDLFKPDQADCADGTSPTF